jgi:hypothetical protein
VAPPAARAPRDAQAPPAHRPARGARRRRPAHDVSSAARDASGGRRSVCDEALQQPPNACARACAPRGRYFATSSCGT